MRATVTSQNGQASLSDGGIGISSEECMFQKFARDETGLVHDVKERRVGLSLVDMLGRAHHGRVEVNSTPGEGSTFTILLPVWDGGRGTGTA